MLKVKRIQLGKQAYRRLLKRVLEQDGWRCQKCGSLKDLKSITGSTVAGEATTAWPIW